MRHIVNYIDFVMEYIASIGGAHASDIDHMKY